MIGHRFSSNDLFVVKFLLESSATMRTCRAMTTAYACLMCFGGEHTVLER